MPRSEAMVTGSPPGVFSHCWMPAKAGAGPHCPSPAPGTPYRTACWQACSEAPPLPPPAARRALFQGVAEGCGVVRDIALDQVGEVERQRDGQDDDDDAADRAKYALMTPESPEALAHGATRKREGEQRDRGADGEAQGEADRAEADVTRGASHDDGGQDRPRAGHEDRTEGDPEHEAAAAGVEGALGEPGEGPLQQVTERRH